MCFRSSSIISVMNSIGKLAWCIRVWCMKASSQKWQDDNKWNEKIFICLIVSGIWMLSERVSAALNKKFHCWGNELKIEYEMVNLPSVESSASLRLISANRRSRVFLKISSLVQTIVRRPDWIPSRWILLRTYRLWIISQNFQSILNWRWYTWIPDDSNWTSVGAV